MPIITLTTDLGQQDFYVAKLKAALMKRIRDVKILDVTHAIANHDIQQAAFFLKNVWSDLPKGSIHIVSVYTHYTRYNKYIIFEYKGHYFIGPNNGIFSLLLEDMEQEQVHQIDYPEGVQNLFELYAHGAACIATETPLREIGNEKITLEKKISILPVHTSNEIRATIIHVDHFGNVVLNVTENFFEHVRKNREFEIYFKHNDPITNISAGYSDVAVGEVLASFNILGHLEIAINMGNASSMLDLYKNETLQIYFRG